MAQTYEEAKAKRQEYNRKKWEQIKADPVLYAEHKAKLSAWHQANPDYERSRSKRRYEANKIPWQEKNARWFKEHREWDNERKRERYHADKEHWHKTNARNKHRAYLSPEQLEGIWERLQNGPCEICGATRADESNRGHSRMSIDHDHETNKYRGILCHRCNLGIGHFRENCEILRKAVEYLERVRAGENPVGS